MDNQQKIKIYFPALASAPFFLLSALNSQFPRQKPEAKKVPIGTGGGKRAIGSLPN